MNNIESIVICGASSCIGSALLRYLHKTGITIFAVAREDKVQKIRSLYGENVIPIACELHNYKDLHKKIPHADVLIQLAWEGTRREDRMNEEIQNKNIQYGIDSIMFAKNIGCSLYVDAGSQAEYGIQLDLVNENSECKPETIYGCAKLNTMIQCRRLSQNIGINYLHLRIFSVFGTGKYDDVINFCIKNIINKTPSHLSSCTQYWNFLYSDDAAGLIWKAILNLYNHQISSNFEILNIAHPESHPLHFYIKRLFSILDSEAKFDFATDTVKANLNSIRPDVSKMMAITDCHDCQSFDESIKFFFSDNYENKHIK